MELGFYTPYWLRVMNFRRVPLCLDIIVNNLSHPRDPTTDHLGKAGWMRHGLLAQASQLITAENPSDVLTKDRNLEVAGPTRPSGVSASAYPRVWHPEARGQRPNKGRAASETKHAATVADIPAPVQGVQLHFGPCALRLMAAA